MQGLTPDEKEILDRLAKAWNLFARLEENHPSDVEEFAKAIHDAQKIIALRVARRIDPDIWS